MSRRTQRRNRRSRRRRRRRSRRRRRGGNVKPRYSSNNVGNQAKKAQANVRRARQGKNVLGAPPKGPAPAPPTPHQVSAGKQAANTAAEKVANVANNAANVAAKKSVAYWCKDAKPGTLVYKRYNCGAGKGPPKCPIGCVSIKPPTAAPTAAPAAGGRRRRRRTRRRQSRRNRRRRTRRNRRRRRRRSRRRRRR